MSLWKRTTPTTISRLHPYPSRPSGSASQPPRPKYCAFRAKGAKQQGDRRQRQPTPPLCPKCCDVSRKARNSTGAAEGHNQLALHAQSGAWFRGHAAKQRPGQVPSRFFRKLIEAASAPPCSSPPPSCSARPSPPASTCPGTSSCPIRAPRCTSASPSPASGPSCRPGRSLRLSSSA